MKEILAAEARKGRLRISPESWTKHLTVTYTDPASWDTFRRNVLEKEAAFKRGHRSNSLSIDAPNQRVTFSGNPFHI